MPKARKGRPTMLVKRFHFLLPNPPEGHEDTEDEVVPLPLITQNYHFVWPMDRDTVGEFENGSNTD